MSLTTCIACRTATRGAGVLLIAGALFGATAGIAQASTAGAAAVGSSHQTPTHTPTAGDAVFLNVTPDRATFSDPNSTAPGWTIGPGQSLLLTAAQLQAFRGSEVQVGLAFPDGSVSSPYRFELAHQPGIQSCGSVPGTAMPVGCVAQVPAGDQGPTQYTVWEHMGDAGGVTTIDTTAPGVDAGAIGEFLSGMRSFLPDWISYAADPGTAPTWGTGQQAQAGPVVWNCGQGQAHEEIGGTAEHSETTSLESSATVGISADLFDLVNTSLSTTITAGNSWTDTTTSSHTESKDIDPYSVGWMTSQPSTETVTGTMTMTGNATEPIAFTHITFTEPGRNPGGDPNLDYSYIAHSLPMTKDQIAQQCTAGPTALAHTVSGGSVSDITAGAVH